MKKRIQNINEKLSKWQRQNIFATPLHIVLLIVVGALFISTFIASFTSQEGQSNVTKLKLYLQEFLEIDLMTLRAEDEIFKLEKLVNRVKTTCEKDAICGDYELWKLLDVVCKKLNIFVDGNEIKVRNSWRLFRAIAQEFYTSYAPERGTQN
ncbi:hypothetical protein OCK74_08720 [Chitinophagaceae bacterium LB-8]|uniref:Transmembrane protein n=1 Tax=Paraflavisolibacter caeni TaxID=2982496 RepID=A0A9X2XV91_9BACT|nr:hypothetical protein [Paraflavisolibacter caeni]MCU7549196.1 hypothetical protein [Paraflavisolibacter caeni]